MFMKLNYCNICDIQISDKRGKHRPRYCIKCFSKSNEWRKGVSKSWFKKGQTSLNKGKVGLKEELNPAWKGSNVGYSALHAWIRRHLGKPKKCFNCGENSKDKRYEWANISGDYRRDKKD